MSAEGASRRGWESCVTGLKKVPKYTYPKLCKKNKKTRTKAKMLQNQIRVALHSQLSESNQRQTPAPAAKIGAAPPALAADASGARAPRSCSAKILASDFATHKESRAPKRAVNRKLLQHVHEMQAFATFRIGVSKPSRRATKRCTLNVFRSRVSLAFFIFTFSLHTGKHENQRMRFRHSSHTAPRIKSVRTKKE